MPLSSLALIHPGGVRKTFEDLSFATPTLIGPELDDAFASGYIGAEPL